MILTAAVLGSYWKASKKGKEVILVTGLATKDFSSDLITWNGSFSTFSVTTKEAYAQIKRDAEAVKNYLLSKGVKEKDMVFSAISINTVTESVKMGTNEYRDVFKGYSLTQNVTIESKEVDKIEQLSRNVTDLIDQGINFNSGQPSYFFTKLSDLKIDLLAQATKDGKLRADKIAENADGHLGSLKHADMGIFQITGQNSTEDYSWGGAFNTSSREKTASITVKLEFDVD